jgi:hypothetical protein
LFFALGISDIGSPKLFAWAGFELRSSQSSSLLYVDPTFNSVSFPTAWRSFIISGRANLMVVNSLSICSSWNIFSLPSFLKEIFARYIIHGWQLFSSQHSVDVTALSSGLHCFWWEARGNS